MVELKEDVECSFRRRICRERQWNPGTISTKTMRLEIVVNKTEDRVK